jgi:hypothetical protein
MLDVSNRPMHGNIALTTILCIPLLEIAHPLDKHLGWYVFIVVKKVTLCCRPSVVDQRIRVSGDSSNTTNDIPFRIAQ